MTRKDYRKIAAVIRESHETAATPHDRLTIGFLASDMADMLAADNPRFDIGMFLDACKGSDS